MDKIKLAVIYYSSYGTNYEMARTAAEAAEEAGAEVRLRKVRETAPEQVVAAQEGWAAHAKATEDVPTAEPEDLVWADAYLFSSPTRYGGASSQMRSFIDTLGPIWQEGKLADKVVTAMTSAMNPHGGQETTLQSLYFTFMHWGAIIVTPGYTGEAVFNSGGNPYGASVTATDGSVNEEDRAAIRHQAKRLVETAERFVHSGAGVG
ncbi:MAG: NAD(P)H:quinone oxidoreductase [Gemmatimonadota bacterium]